ncbi:MAG: tetratricopeptide repeat protein [Bradymonadales bacterium]|nr:tetratricopeptide repeat protein [Bradymonadales bacterium]
MDTIPLGAFELIHRLRSGGMGEIWQGVHRTQGVSVAVKVITRAHAREPRYLSAFRHEVQATARLEHPGIVMLFDVGEITHEAQAASGGGLIAKSPYLVMEYASYGSLSQVPLPLAWGELYTLLQFLLDVLAHAHARGVIHRDLKPGNILFSGPQDWRPGPKLTDFGIAHALGGQSQGVLARTSMGSPPYMAPEQWRDEWRDYGPWTDLYGLGCLAYHLATAMLPFSGQDPLQVARGHMSQPPPPLDPGLGLPEGFEGWLFRLLQKHPKNRFQRAADAARALLALSGSGPKGFPLSSGPPTGAGADQEQEEPTSVLHVAARQLRESPTLVLESQPTVEMEVPSWIIHPDQGEQPLCAIPAPMVPDSWERPATPHRSMQLVGTGLGLYGLRPIPLVNRKNELDVLWRAFQEVQAQKRPSLVLVTGSAGYGKSCLVEWMCERCHEVGAATILKAVHSPIAGLGSGLSRMVAHQLHTAGLTRQAVLERARQLVEAQGYRQEYEWQALTELVAPASRPEDLGSGPTVRFGQAVERYALIRRLLERLCAERPCVVWLDDVQWGHDALCFAEYMVCEPSPNPLPVLLLATVEQEALASRPVEEAQVKQLLKRRRTRQLAVGPLAPQHRLELISNLLRLEGDLVHLVDRRTEGNPLFAVQLVGDWVRRGVLVVGQTGFVVKATEHARLPDDIHMLWVIRLERALDEYATPAGGGAINTRLRVEGEIALEVASVLGGHIDWTEWEVACKHSGIASHIDLVDALIGARLAYRGQTSWTFEHTMLCESLQRLAHERGRWAAHHRACAAMLESLHPTKTKIQCERLGLHLFEAGEMEAALDPLIQGVFQRVRHKETRSALRLLDLRERALEGLRVGGNDLRLAKGWLLRARILNDQADWAGALGWARRAADAARVIGSDLVMAEALYVEGQTLRQQGQIEEALQRYERAIRLFRPLDAPMLLARCLLYYAYALLPVGELERAWTCLEEAQSLSLEAGEEETWVDCLQGLAQVSLERGDLPRARALTEQALAYYTREGNRYGMAGCLNNLGECQRLQGDLDGARGHYQKSMELLESLGLLVNTFSIRLNLALLLLQTRRFAEARQEIETAARLMKQRNLQIRLGSAHCLNLAAIAGNRDWAAWDRTVKQVLAFTQRSGMAERDNAWALQLAGDLAFEGGQLERARQAYHLAASLWDALGARDQVKQVQTSLARCRQ